VAAGTELAIYLSWDTLGAYWIIGVQGRYFLPLAMFLCLIGRRPGIVATAIGAAAVLVILVTGDFAALQAAATRYPH
jgi:uncharacterized membrane protein